MLALHTWPGFFVLIITVMVELCSSCKELAARDRWTQLLWFLVLGNLQLYALGSLKSISKMDFAPEVLRFIIHVKFTFNTLKLYRVYPCDETFSSCFTVWRSTCSNRKSVSVMTRRFVMLK